MYRRDPNVSVPMGSLSQGSRTRAIRDEFVEYKECSRLWEIHLKRLVSIAYNAARQFSRRINIRQSIGANAIKTVPMAPVPWQVGIPISGGFIH